MKGEYKRPSELLQLLKETGKSYWDLIGRPLEAPKKMSKEEIEYLKIMDRVDKILMLPSYKGGKGGKGKKTGYYTADGHYVRYDSGDQYWNLLTNAQKKEFADFVNFFRENGWNDTDIAGMAGNVMQESGFIPTIISPVDKNGHRYHGLYLNQDRGGLMDQVVNIYGDHSSLSLKRFVNDMMHGNEKKVGKAIVKYGSKYKMGTYATPAESSKAFRAAYERPTDPTDIVRDIYAGYAYDIINKLWPLLLAEPVVLEDVLPRQASPLISTLMNTAKRYLLLVLEPVSVVQPLAVEKHTQLAEPISQIDALLFRPNRMGSITDLWKDTVDDYGDFYQYKHGKSYQFPFWNRQWNALTPPIKYGCGKRGG